MHSLACTLAFTLASQSASSLTLLTTLLFARLRALKPHCVFSNVGYDVDQGSDVAIDDDEDGAAAQTTGSAARARRRHRRWTYSRDRRLAALPLLYAGNASLDRFPPCFVPSHPRGAMEHETYCFSPALRYTRTPPSWETTAYERGVLLSWAGAISNFGHMVSAPRLLAA